MMDLRGTGPQKRLSSDSPRLSPIMNQCPGGMVMGVGSVHPRLALFAHVLEMYGSFSRLPLRITWPSTMRMMSPGPATTRLMKLTLAWPAVGLSQAAFSSFVRSPHVSVSEPAGGWKTTMSPTFGSLKRWPMRLTRTRWPISRVGTIDSLGIRYGLTRNAWMPRARPRATATMRTSSSSEPDAVDAPLFVLAGLLVRFIGRGGGLGRGLGLRSLSLRGDLRDLGSLRQRLLVHGLAGDLGVRVRGRLGRGVVEQAALDDLLRTGVAALAHPRALADATAQVVELGAPDVPARRDLDPLDLRRVQRERALNADAEGLLADREGLAHAFALALDHHALEDLRAPPRALDDLEVDLDTVPGLEAGDAAQLRALEGVDDGAHGVGRPTGNVPAGGRSW